MVKTRHLPQNDESCGWLKGLPSRTTNPPLKEEIRAEWVIIGAGFTGMAAARQLATLHPDQRIVLLEANRAAEGASARNSGFLIDATLNEGYGTAGDVEAFQRKFNLNVEAIAEVRHLVETYSIDCDWDPCGKLYGARHHKYFPKLENFSRLLTELGLDHDVLTGAELNSALGTEFYNMAVRTKGSVMLHTGKLARGLLNALPDQIELYEDTPVLEWQRRDGRWEINTPEGRISAQNLIFATNAFTPELRAMPNRSFGLGLTASMSRVLTDAEYQSIGAPAPYGLLSVDLMGATVRITSDRRLLIRNTCEVVPRMAMSQGDLAHRRKYHIAALHKRFPTLPPEIFEHSWSGYVNISANTEHVFTQIRENAWVAGCYNANGIGLANLFGREIANLASGQDSEVIPRIQARCNPARLPPQPFMYWGARLRLAKGRITGRSEE